MKFIIVNVDESSDRVITGRWEFNRDLGGIIQIPTDASFPTSMFPGEMFFNSLSGSVFIRNSSNSEWMTIGGVSPTSALVVMALTSSLSGERLLTSSTGLRVVDGGSTATVSINNNIVATVSGTRFTGPVSASVGLSGSLQRVNSSLTYLAPSGAISLTSQSNGQVIVTNTFSPTTISDNMATYIVAGPPTASLYNERTLSLSGSSISASDNGTTLVLDIGATGSPGVYQGRGVQINNEGFVTSGSTSFLGQHIWYVTGSSAEPFSNATATYRTALALTASNLTPGIYRFGWCYTYYRASNSVSFRARCFIYNSASYDTVEEVSEIGANERNMRCGFAFVRVTGSVAEFALEVSNESGTAANRVYDRALELWRVS